MCSMHESSLKYGGLRIKAGSAWVVIGRARAELRAGATPGREGRWVGTLAALASAAPSADRPCPFGTIGVRTLAEFLSGGRR